MRAFWLLVFLGAVWAGCSEPRCGDGIIDTDLGEQCDDRNATTGDGCEADCRLPPPPPPPPRCGDGVVNEGEQCDDGNNLDGDGCEADCTLACEEPIDCDDDNACTVESCVSNCCLFEVVDPNDNNACTVDSCDPAAGVVNAPVEIDDNTDCTVDACDPAQGVSHDPADDGIACTQDNNQPGVCIAASCEPIVCGDGFVSGNNEQCDDGNVANGDGCSSVCAFENCGDGNEDAGEECDDGNATNTDTCLNDCVDASCGDGFIRAGVEQCDDTNQSNNDACTNVCQNARCGDGIIRNGVETCDDGNTTNGDGCSSVCTSENNSCAHDFCDQGAALANNCDPCVTTICAADSFCCTNTWDSQCVAQVASRCGISCNAGPVCGNGAIEAGETCDDGNVANGDGCSSACLIEGNGSCASPFTLGLGTVTGNTTGFLNIINPSCQQAGSPDIAFRFTSPDTATRTFTLTSNNDQGIILHSACPGTELGCVDAVAGSAAAPETETITLNMTAGQTIFVFVGSFTATTIGPFTLTIQ